MFEQTFHIATIPLRLTSPAAWHPSTMYFSSICAGFGRPLPPSTPHWTIRVTSSVLSPCAMPPTQDREGIHYSERGPFLRIIAPGAMVLINTAARDITLILTESDPVVRDRTVLEYLKFAVSSEVLYRGGLPLHASAVMRPQGDVLLFTAPSGTGKTTIARHLHNPGQVLNDEYVVILPTETGYAAHATPFTAPAKLRICSNITAPIHTIYLLRQSDRIHSERVALKDSLFGILQGVYTLPTSATEAERIFTGVEQVTRHVRTRRLYFPDNREMLTRWAFTDHTIADGINI